MHIGHGVPASARVVFRCKPTVHDSHEPSCMFRGFRPVHCRELSTPHSHPANMGTPQVLKQTSELGKGQNSSINTAAYVMQANSTAEKPSDSCSRWPSTLLIFANQSVISIFTAPVVTTKLRVCVQDGHTRQDVGGA